MTLDRTRDDYHTEDRAGPTLRRPATWDREIGPARDRMLPCGRMFSDPTRTRPCSGVNFNARSRFNVPGGADD